LIRFLKDRLCRPLPGIHAQLELSSRLRADYWLAPPAHKKSGVLILLYPNENDWQLVLMKRSTDGRTHSGQICFPGGRMEESDRDLMVTALRESHEELGISIPSVEILGHLTELYIPASNYLVAPTLGYSQMRPVFLPSPAEVAEVIEVSLTYLLSPQSRTYAEVYTSSGLHMEVPAFKVGGHVVWGATAMILNEFLTLVREAPRFSRA